MRSRRAFWAITALLALGHAGCVVSAQTPSSPTFEVASIRQNRTSEGGSFLPREGLFQAQNLSLRTLISDAYGVQEFLIDDRAMPDWVRSDRWDVTAKPPADVTGVGPFPGMLQRLLSDRFALRIRSEPRQLPAYRLARVRPDRLGPALVPFTGECQTPQRSEGERCWLSIKLSIQSSSIEAVGYEWAAIGLARHLMGGLERPILDGTGLTGPFNVHLRWVPGLQASPGDGDSVTLFTALREQLGLELTSVTATTDVLVIESAERPTEN